MTAERSFRFSNALCRAPADSVTGGLRSGGLRSGVGGDPDPVAFRNQHAAYVAALERAGVTVHVLPALEAFPDSVFVEDAALCVAAAAIALRPGAASRTGETAVLRPDLKARIGRVLDLPGSGSVDGGDVLLTDDEALIGLSARTDEAGFDALADILRDFGYRTRKVVTPPEILHFKTDCGLLDSRTIFSSARLAATGCFDGYQVIEAPKGEDAAANLIRVNDTVFVSAGHPATEALLRDRGYRVIPLDTSEAARVDGGLSCMSLRFALG